MKNRDINKYKLKGWNYKPHRNIRAFLRKIDRKDYNIPQNIKFK